jgi:ferredoxin--NADP+ reductase
MFPGDHRMAGPTNVQDASNVRGMSAADTKQRVAVVGAGPSGFYACASLLKEGFEVDLYDLLPTPFGLVRAGVAPDHPKIKAVIKKYEQTAQHDDFRFFGGVKLGEDIGRAELRARYHAVLYTVGSSSDNRLGIEGEDLPGSHAATEFVAWYNGHPHYADREFDLSVKRAVVIGNGNVAIDVARMLVLDADEVAPTDTADHAVEALKAAKIEEVILLGRRGPAQAAFTNPELRELGELSRADIVVEAGDLELDEDSLAWLESEQAHATNRKNVEIMRDYAARDLSGSDKTHRIVLRFLSSPVEILGTDRVEGIRVCSNRIERQEDGSLKAVGTDETEDIECGLVLRSIGYRGEPLDDIPFDDRRGLIRNEDGRVVGEGGEPEVGEYVAGWIKRGPSGVIGTNKKCATDTVSRMLEDRDAGKLNEPTETGDVEAWLRERVPTLVTWAGWERIDQHEQSLGEPQGRPRVKLVDVDEMAEVAGG